MRGGERVLLVGKHLLVELLARTETRVCDLDVLAHLKASQLDHAARQGVDLDTLAHVEDEDLVALAHDGGLHHQTAGLRDGHEETCDVGMGHRHRTTVLDLLAETRDDAAVAAQHVAETRGDELGLPLVLALRNGETQRLDVNLGQTLRTPHHIGGVHRLVGTDHHHLLHVVLNTLVGHVARAVHVDEHGLAGVLLHERHMLVGRGMEHHLGMIVPKGEVETCQLPHIADYGDETQPREAAFQLEAQVVHGRLGVVKQDELLDAESGQLTAQLTANATRRTRHQHHLAGE